jgi:hypothetical protein
MSTTMMSNTTMSGYETTTIDQFHNDLMLLSTGIWFTTLTALMVLKTAMDFTLMVLKTAMDSADWIWSSFAGQSEAQVTEVLTESAILEVDDEFRLTRQTVAYIPPPVTIGTCRLRSDIKSDRPHCQRMRNHSIEDGWRRIDVDGKILEIACRGGGWCPTLGMTGSIQDLDGVWSYIGKRDERCTFFENGNYLSHYRVAPYVQV